METLKLTFAGGATIPTKRYSLVVPPGGCPLAELAMAVDTVFALTDTQYAVLSDAAKACLRPLFPEEGQQEPSPREEEGLPFWQEQGTATLAAPPSSPKWEIKR